MCYTLIVGLAGGLAPPPGRFPGAWPPWGSPCPPLCSIGSSRFRLAFRAGASRASTRPPTPFGSGVLLPLVNVLRPRACSGPSAICPRPLVLPVRPAPWVSRRWSSLRLRARSSRLAPWRAGRSVQWSKSSCRLISPSPWCAARWCRVGWAWCLRSRVSVSARPRRRALLGGSVMFPVSSVFSSGAVALGGSRGLVGPGTVALGDLVQSLQVAGHPLAVGCSTGADSDVLWLAPGNGPVSVFAVCDPSGAGAWRNTAVYLVHGAARLGASVQWLAGGPLSLALPVRLAARTRAVAAAASAGAVIAISSPDSVGSLLLARSVAARRLPVVALACGFSWLSLPPMASGGFWRKLGVGPGVVAAQWVRG